MDKEEKLNCSEPEATADDGLGSKSNSVWWVFVSVVACLIFFSIGEFVQPSAVEQRFYLSPKGLVLSPLLQAEVVELGPESENIFAMTSPAFRGRLKPGVATIHWAADGAVGAKVKARFSLDIDGDSAYDVLHESEVVALDADDGFEKLTSNFLLDESELAEKGPYTLRVELLVGDEDAENVRIELQPQHSHLVFPVVGFEPV